MILNSYSIYKDSIIFEKNVTGYFIERFLHFNHQKNINFKFFSKYFSYNSNRANYFVSLFQCFLRVKKEKSTHNKNMLSRINLLKLRYEISETNTPHFYKYKQKLHWNDSKTYGSFNNLSLIPKKIKIFSFSRIQIVIKKLFLGNSYKLFFIQWFWFFENFKKITKMRISNIIYSILKSQIGLYNIVNNVPLNKLILNFKNHSWLNGFISLINYERRINSKKNTLLYLRVGILKLNQFIFSRKLKKIKPKYKICQKKTCFSFSVDPIFCQIIPDLNYYIPNLSLDGIYGFKILASKKKLPLKLYTSFFSNLEFFNFFLEQNIFRKNGWKNVPNYEMGKNLRKSIRRVDFLSKLPNITSKIMFRKECSIFSQLIIKEANDFDKELGAILLLSQIEKILREYQIDTWFNPLSFNNYCYNGGIVEVIPNSKSIHEIKSLSFSKNLKFWPQKNSENIQEKKIIKNFLQSLAGYSLFCYLFQVKDRHNANILLNSDKRIIHVDFAFILGSLPGNLKLEATSFKMSGDFISLMKGKHSQSFDHLKEVFTRSFMILKKNIGKIVKISKFFILEGQKKGKNRFRILELIRRFGINYNDFNSIRSCHLLFKDSLEDWRTEQYDKYQLFASGIKI